jgi:hypothetical protein
VDDDQPDEPGDRDHRYFGRDRRRRGPRRSEPGRAPRQVDRFEVTGIRGRVVAGVVEHVRVGMKVGFRLEEQDERAG